MAHDIFWQQSGNIVGKFHHLINLPNLYSYDPDAVSFDYDFV